jgi:hypothetical protein
LTSTIHINPLDLPDSAFLAKAEQMCASKAAFTTRAEASAFTKRSGYNQAAYRCPWCHNWHLTSYDRARAKAFNRRLRRLLRTPSEP